MSMSMEEPLAPILPLYSFYLLYRLRILNLILRFSESHVYFRVTADTFFLLPSFGENLHCSCPWYQSLVKSNDLILIR